MSFESLGGGVYGTNATNAVTYGLGTVANTAVVTNAKFTEMVNYSNSERSRRGNAQVGVTLNTNIDYRDYNAIINLLNVNGQAASSSYNVSGTATVVTFPQVGPPSLPAAVATGNNITAAQINALVGSINSAGAQCTCNCNYCTCNCNYCTCNCNYSCTCNCNYSDRRLKTKVKYLGMIDGLRIYSFAYVWERNKGYVGIMAQDLIGTMYESALSTDQNGYYVVDYSKLSVSMMEV